MARNSGGISLNGKKLRHARERRGWSQETLADNAKISDVRTVRSAEAGNTVSIKTVNGILEALNSFLQPGESRITVDDLRKTPPPLPPRPKTCLGREDTLKRLAQELVDGGRHVLLYGMPGIGKTTVALEIAHRIQSGFPDGVLWTTLGYKVSNTTLRQELQDWGRAVDVPEVNVLNSLIRISDAMRSALADKSCLIIIDDVWQPQDASCFCIGGAQCATLVTSRRCNLDDELWSDFRPDGLQGLSEADSLELLRQGAGDLVDKHIEDCRVLVEKLGGLPVALQIASRQLRNHHQRHRDAKELLTLFNQDVSPLLEQIVPTRYGYLAEDANPSVFALFDSTYRQFDDEMKEWLCGVWHDEAESGHVSLAAYRRDLGEGPILSRNHVGPFPRRWDRRAGRSRRRRSVGIQGALVGCRSRRSSS